MSAVMSESVGNLAAAVCAVTAAVRGVQKTGVNTHHKYRYASDADLLYAVRQSMAANGLCLPCIGCPEVDTGPHVRGVFRFRLTHTSGEWMVVEAIGEGVDKQDKAAYKAMTGALKYVYRQTFAIPTGDDPENDERARKGAAAAERSTTAEPTRNAESPAVDENGHHPSFAADQGRFFGRLGEMGLKYDAVKAHMGALGRPKPSAMPQEQRDKLLVWLESGGANEIKAAGEAP